MSNIDGFYAVYITGAAQQGFAMTVFRKGKIVGVDIGGVKYDGNYSEDATGLSVKLKVVIPPNSPLVQGVTTGPQEETSELEFHLPPDFTSLPFVRVDAKHGPVNAKLVMLRGIDD